MLARVVIFLVVLALIVGGVLWWRAAGKAEDVFSDTTEDDEYLEVEVAAVPLDETPPGQFMSVESQQFLANAKQARKRNAQGRFIRE